MIKSTLGIAAALSLAAGPAPVAAQESFYATGLTAYETHPGGPSQQLLLVGLGADAMKFKTFSALSGRWEGWRSVAYPVDGQPGWEYRTFRVNLPLVTYLDNGRWRSNAYYVDESSTTSLGAPWWLDSAESVSLDYHPGAVDVHGDRFVPASAAARKSATATHLHFFGETRRDPACQSSPSSDGTGLRERWWNADLGRWQFQYHGCPARFMDVHVGSQAVALTRRNLPYDASQPVHLFVAVGVSASNAIWVRHRSTGGAADLAAAWLSLGAPPGTSQPNLHPIVFSHDRGDGVWRTHVFAVALLAADQRFHLFEKFVDTGSDPADWGRNWSPWSDHGSPPELPTQTPFEMQAAVVRTPNAGLRISLWGKAYYYSPSAGSAAPSGGQLLERRWDGASWSWERTPGPPDGISQAPPRSVFIGAATAWDQDRQQSVVVLDDMGKMFERRIDAAGNASWIAHP